MKMQPVVTHSNTYYYVLLTVLTTDQIFFLIGYEPHFVLAYMSHKSLMLIKNTYAIIYSIFFI